MAAAGPVSVSVASRGILTSTHSWDVDSSLPVSHWLSPAALAASSATSVLLGGALALALEDASAVTWPLVSAVAEPSSTSVRPALATVGSVSGSCFDSTAASGSVDCWVVSLCVYGARWAIAAFLTWATGNS